MDPPTANEALTMLPSLRQRRAENNSALAPRASGKDP